MSWLRRGLSAPGAAAPEPDDVAVLRTDLVSLRRYINRNAGQVPVGSVVTAHCVCDALGEILQLADNRTLDMHTVVSIGGFLNDYLPTTLRSFLAVADAPGSTAAEQLTEQLDALLDAASDLLAAARTHDADALAVHGTFLNTKFSRSDLDL